MASTLLLLAAITLAFSPAYTMLVGAAWLFVLIAGIASWLTARGKRSPLTPLNQATGIWLVACATATSIWLIQSWLWDEPLFGLTGNLNSALRLLLMALACHALCKNLTVADSRFIRNGIGDMLALACIGALLALAWAGFDRNATPTHAIPWSVVNAVIVYLLLTETLSGDLEPARRIGWFLGIAAGLLAVLLSQTRIAYIVLPMGFWLILKHVMQSKWPRHRIWMAIGAALLLAAALVTIAARPSDPLKVRIAFEEARTSLAEGDYNSSIGARVAFYGIGLQAVSESPWTGIGARARIERIQQAGKQASPEDQARWAYVRTFNHLHNQYLNNLVDGGLLSLSGLLAIAIGMWIAAARLKYLKPMANRQMRGLLLIHLAAGLTNVNFVHDYYSTMLGLLLGCIFLLSKCNENNNI